MTRAASPFPIRGHIPDVATWLERAGMPMHAETVRNKERVIANLARENAELRESVSRLNQSLIDSYEAEIKAEEYPRPSSDTPSPWRAATVALLAMLAAYGAIKVGYYVPEIFEALKWAMQ